MNYKFYILYKDTTDVQGTINCTEEEFIKRFITPDKENIHSYMHWKSAEPNKQEEFNILIEEL